MALGEFEFIEQLRELFPSPDGVLGIGDDCAVVPFSAARGLPGFAADGRADAPCLANGELLVSTDLLTEGVHFRLDWMTPRQLGWKSAMVNISDIAAMGGVPRWAFLSLAIPQNHKDADLMAFMQGFKEASDRYGVQLLGGDTCRSRALLTVNVTIMGTCEAGSSVKRSGARAGDLICVSGTLGDSAAGLALLQEGRQGGGERTCPSRNIADNRSERLIQHHLEPVSRVELGRALAAMPGIGAMMDLSDGLAADLPHILKASSPLAAATGNASLGAVIDIDKIPLSDDLRSVCAEMGWDALSLALEGGEDYELLFTCRPDAPLESLQQTGLLGITVVGRITDTPGIQWQGAHREFHGFRHF
ncbi:MAG: thiamine-phosphate kinase [Bacteroidales bacterium]|nr:thiamine-phosphate kinase [Bacteroidales bacterium]